MCGKLMQNLNRRIGTLGLHTRARVVLNGASGTDSRTERPPVAGHPCGRPSGGTSNGRGTDRYVQIALIFPHNAKVLIQAVPSGMLSGSSPLASRRPQVGFGGPSSQTHVQDWKS